MSLDTADWENQRAFLAVMNGGSLSAASRALGVAQPTVRRRLEALEQALGAALFTRSPNGLSPTDAARELIPHAEAMAAAAAAFARASTSKGDEISGTVRITASEVIGAEVLPSMLTELRRLHPLLGFELNLSNRTQDLLRQDADIAVRMVRPAQSALVMKHVGAIRVGFFAHPAYLERHGMPTGLDALDGHTFIGPDRAADDLRVVRDIFGPGPIKALNYRTDSHLGQLAAVRAGTGIGVCQLQLARREPKLVRVLPEVLEFPLETWIVMHEDLRRVPRIRATFDHLVTAMTEYCAG